MTDQPASFTGVHLLTLMRKYKAVQAEALLLASGDAQRHDRQTFVLQALALADGIVDQLERAWGINTQSEEQDDGR